VSPTGNGRGVACVRPETQPSTVGTFDNRVHSVSSLSGHKLHLRWPRGCGARIQGNRLTGPARWTPLSRSSTSKRASRSRSGDLARPLLRCSPTRARYRPPLAIGSTPFASPVLELREPLARIIVLRISRNSSNFTRSQACARHPADPSRETADPVSADPAPAPGSDRRGPHAAGYHL